MTNIEELQERLKKVENIIKGYDREIYSMNEKLNKATNLLVDIVENNNVNTHDLEYVLLKLHIDGELYNEFPMLVSNTELLYRDTGEYPTLQEFHKKVIDLFSLKEDDLKVFSEEVTINGLKKL